MQSLMRHAPWLVLVAACTSHEAPVKLDALPELHLTVVARADVLSVELGYNPLALGTCALLAAELTASVNGAAMEIERGGYDASADDCTVPHVAMRSPPMVDGAILVIRDSSKTVTIDLGDRLLPRTMSLVPAGPWELFGGQTYTVEWSPHSDLAAGALVSLETPLGSTLSIDTATVTAAGIVFTEPSAQFTGAGGQGTLVISTSVDRVDSCGGLPCTWDDVRELSAPVNLHVP